MLKVLLLLLLILLLLLYLIGLTERRANHIILSYCLLSVSYRSIFDRCGSLGAIITDLFFKYFSCGNGNFQPSCREIKQRLFILDPGVLGYEYFHVEVYSYLLGVICWYNIYTAYETMCFLDLSVRMMYSKGPLKWYSI